ncbi:MAG: FhaA domain-containing protein [Chloroflexota bacterium]
MLARFEQLMQDAVEGSLRRVFPTTLQPVQLAKAAARAMEQGQVIGVHGPQVANAYRLRLAPRDLERFAHYAATLSLELSRYLVEYARERGLQPIAEPRVELLGDATVKVGTVRAEAQFVDLAPALKKAVEAGAAGTRRLRLADLASARAAARDTYAEGNPVLWLVDASGERFLLESQVGIVRVGRGADNDLVLSNQRVSRYHAQVRWVESSWLVYDLDSTNGTWVDEQRVLPSRPNQLTHGAVVRFGDHELSARSEHDLAPASHPD